MADMGFVGFAVSSTTLDFRSSFLGVHQICTRALTCRTRTQAQSRSFARCAVDESTSDALYLDDAFGGFKGIRRSVESDSWGTSGKLVEVHERSGTRCFTRAWGAPAEVAVADVLLLPGWPSPCYLVRDAAARAAALTPGLRVVSFDWPGVGESDAPQDALKGFKYDRATMLECASHVARYYELGATGRRFVVVAQGYLATDIALELATSHNTSAVVLFTPALGDAAAKLPTELHKLRNPLFGPLLTGNPAHMADKVFSSSTPYNIEEKTMMVLRSPFLRAGGPGFAARATACNVDWRALSSNSIQQLQASVTPIHFILTSGDKWLDHQSLRKTIESYKCSAEKAQNVKVTEWEYSGHFCFEDAPDDCGKLISQEVSSIL